MLPVALSGACMAVPDPAPVATTAPFDVAAFFTGESRGTGTLRILGRDPVPVHVSSKGRIEGDGSLRLDQTIREGGKAARVRHWTLKRDGAARWTGTLTDATGPVEAVAAPGRLAIAYPARDGVTIRQTLTLSADGRSADNVLVGRIAGVTVAVLHERIARVPE